ncbi:hypothetical protein [Kamptonema formosum]|uniref:hypothetical protein n=1 Tax=Kamptonema formosum TaxID=331992 RepID=UPI00034B3FDA|nr:hypothetical protein [Oscillatoria sp. PCC 10802]
MRPDLQGLQITKGELRRLTGVGVGNVLIPPTPPTFLSEIAQSLLIIFLMAVSGILLNYLFPESRPLLIATYVLASLALIGEDVKKINFSLRNKILVNLFEDVERYNDVIQAIDINDQLEAAGNPEVSLTDREKVIAALELTREDLVRALRTERILRAHRSFIARNPELFANNLTALTALQVSDRASEHGKLLNEALQIAVSAQAEMRKLQDQRLS